MHPLVGMPSFYLRFYESPELALNGPPAAEPFGVPDLEYDLNALLVERVHVDPDAIVEESVYDPQ